MSVYILHSCSGVVLCECLLVRKGMNPSFLVLGKSQNRVGSLASVYQNKSRINLEFKTHCHLLITLSFLFSENFEFKNYTPLKRWRYVAFFPWGRVWVNIYIYTTLFKDSATLWLVKSADSNEDMFKDFYQNNTTLSPLRNILVAKLLNKSNESDKTFQKSINNFLKIHLGIFRVNI